MPRQPSVHARTAGLFALWLLLCTVSFGALAQPRAWLDRDAVNAGETVTLNIETTSLSGAGPDYSPLT